MITRRMLTIVLTLVAAAVSMAACARTTPMASPEPMATPAVTSTPSPIPYNLGQRLTFERISVEHGLSQSTVTCVLQDSRGFMWFGTPNGLNRYDGSGFKVYKHDPQNPEGLGHNQVTALAEDPAGMLWIGTDGGGLDRLDRETDTFAHFLHDPGDPRSLAHNLVLSLHVDRGGVLWIGTGSGLDRHDPTGTQIAPNGPRPAGWSP